MDEKIIREIMKKYPGYEVIEGHFSGGKKRFFSHVTGDDGETISVGVFSRAAKSLKSVSKYTGIEYGKSEIVYNTTSKISGYSLQRFLMVAEKL